MADGNVTNMSAMFLYAWSFDSDLSEWDTGNVRNMKEMFLEATTFTNKLLVSTIHLWLKENKSTTHIQT